MDAKAAIVSAKAWTTEVRIRFSHCDPAGIVYFPRAFDILNGVVEDWFTFGLGIDYRDVIVRRRIGLGYAHAECDFTKTATMGDTLTFAVLVERIGAKSLSLVIPARRGSEDVFKASLVIVATDLNRHVSIPIPDDIRTAVTAYREGMA
jgi:4-hydroxybenzoyl-CoA thioesterase